MPDRPIQGPAPTICRAQRTCYRSFGDPAALGRRAVVAAPGARMIRSARGEKRDRVMTHRNRLGALGALVLLVSGAASQADNQALAAVRRAIDAGNARYIDACARLDANAFAAVYDRDAARLERGGEVVLGRAAIAKTTGERWTKLAGPLMVTAKTQEVWLVDNIAYETGRYTLAVTSPGGVTRQVSGRYVTLWKKQPDGGWKIFRDLNVSQDEPRPVTS
jgi:uncharacterized protein (TIGR02246 family)